MPRFLELQAAGPSLDFHTTPSRVGKPTSASRHPPARDQRCTRSERKKEAKKESSYKIYYIHRAPGRRAKPRLSYNSHRVGNPTSASRHPPARFKR